MAIKQLKQKKCKSCLQLFTPFSSLAKCCSVPCAQALVKTNKRKEFNRDLRKAKERVKTKGQHLREAQQVFNRFIRQRDVALPCVSCLRFHSGQYHAGHFLTVGGHPEWRFDEDNCHKQCAPCNNHLSGNIAAYRPELLRRIGAERVARLEGPRGPLKLSIDEIKAIKAEYKQKLKDLNITNM